MGDKYNFLELSKATALEFGNQLESWLDGLKPSATASKDFSDIVNTIYNLPNAKSEHPMVATIMKLTKECKMVRIYDTAGQASVLLVEAAQKIPKFGRDLFLFMTGEVKM